MLRAGGRPTSSSVTVALAREMLALAGIKGVDPAAKLAAGEALPVWWDMVAAQGVRARSSFPSRPPGSGS